MVKTRMYEQEDYKKIMDFLKEMYSINGNQDCWLPARWEYAEHFVNPLFVEMGFESWEGAIKIWEEENRIVAIAHIEDTCNTFFQIRPGYEYLHTEMLAWSEENYALPTEDGKHKRIVIWSKESDTALNDLLTERGYKKAGACNYLNLQTIDTEKEYEPQVAEGFIVRSMAENIDLCKRYNVINQAFNPSAEYKVEAPKSFFRMIDAPMYRPDLDIVTEFKDGSLASACVVWYDEENKIGMFEPVGTHPDYQRKGLGQVVLIEGLKRLQKIGAKKAYVESFGDERYAFYESAGFKAYDQDYPWEKII